MLILDLWSISFHAVVVFGLDKNLSFKSMLGRCGFLDISGDFLVIQIGTYLKIIPKLQKWIHIFSTSTNHIWYKTVMFHIISKRNSQYQITVLCYQFVDLTDYFWSGRNRFKSTFVQTCVQYSCLWNAIKIFEYLLKLAMSCLLISA